MSYIAKPFAWLFLFLYNIVDNYGLAIILFALLVRLILTPFQMKSKRGMLQQTRLSPRLKELEKKYEGNKEKYNQEVARIYKEEKVNPLSGCLWSLIPFPILIALYTVVRQPLSQLMGLTADQVTLVTDALANLGVTIANPSGAYAQLEIANHVNTYFDQIKAVVPEVLRIDFSFIGLDLSATPQWNFFLDTDWSSFGAVWPAFGLFLIPILSAVMSFLSTKISQKMNGTAQAAEGSMKTMMLMSPLISLWIGFVMPAALGLYWAAGSVFTIIQDVILTKRYTKILDAQDAVRSAERREREIEIEAKRAETERLKALNATVRNPNTSKRKLQKTEKQQATEKAVEFAKKDIETQEEPSRVDNRRFARGRAYESGRFDDEGQAGGEPEREDDESAEFAEDYELVDDIETEDDEAGDGADED